MDVQLELICEYLKNNGFDLAYVKETYIYVEQIIEEKRITLKCDVNTPFPYDFPVIYIEKDLSDELESIPHKNTDGSLCLFDKGMAIPNFMMPEKVLYDSLKKAFKLIKDGILGTNSYDFIEEMTAYWSSNMLSADSFLDENESTGKIYFTINSKCSPYIIICDTSNEVIRIAKVLWGCKSVSIYEGFHIRIDGTGLTNIPENDVQVIDMIKNHSYQNNDYIKYMQKNLGRLKLIFMSIKMNNGEMSVGWIHKAAKLPHGFRKNKANIKLAYSAKNTEIGKPVSITDCSHKRLFKRGSDGSSTCWRDVVIIGCGAVGSNIAQIMMHMGTKRFTLLDNQLLTSENIARHYCGYTSIGLKKVTAVSKTMMEHNPNIICDCYGDDVHVFLEDRIHKLDKKDLIVVAVGNIAVEHHVLETFNKGLFKSPLLILWMEPYGIGGHVLLIHRKQNLYEELFSVEDYSFKKGIVKNPSLYLKQEAGCQSSYMPYSAFNVTMFNQSIIEYVYSNDLSENQNYLLTWIGKISEAPRYNIDIEEKYRECKEFSIIKQRID